MRKSPRVWSPAWPWTASCWRGLAAALVLCALVASTSRAADELEIELATARDAPLAAQRGWHDLLESQFPGRVRLRPFRGGEQPQIERPDPGSRGPTRVVAVITGDGALVVPGASFALAQRTRARDWFTALASPTSEPTVTGDHGFDPTALDGLRGVLGKPISQVTRGQDRWAVYDRLCEDLGLPVVAETAAEIAIRDRRQAGPDLLADELQHLAHGTGLAVLLDGVELGLRPEVRGAGRFRLVVTPLAGAERIWPVGTALAGSGRDRAPKLFEFVDIDLPAQPFDQAVGWFSARTEVPVLVDRRAVAERGLDLANHLSAIPPKRTAYLMVLRGLAGPARLKLHLRLDDGGRPFVWLGPTFGSTVEKDRARRSGFGDVAPEPNADGEDR